MEVSSKMAVLLSELIIAFLLGTNTFSITVVLQARVFLLAMRVAETVRKGESLAA